MEVLRRLAENFWRTMDSEFVKHIMKNHKFNGDIIKQSFDRVIGELTGFLRASVGLESVFMSKEMKLNKHDGDIKMAN